MAPKKAAKASKGTTVPTRRSGRIASRENSKEPSVEPLAAAAPAPAALQPAVAAVPEEKTAVKSTTVVKKTLSTEEHILVLKNMNRDRRPRAPVAMSKHIDSLTPGECKAVIFGLAQQSNDLDDRVEDLEKDLEYATNEVNKWKERSRPNIRRDAFYKKMDEYAAADAEAEKKISDAQTEENTTTTSPVAAATTPTAASAGSVAPAQSPPHQADQESPAPVVLSSPQTAAQEIVLAAPAAPSPWKKIMSSLSGYLPGLRKRAAEDEAATEAPTPKRTRVEEPDKTPVTRPTHAKHLMRSVKNPAVPSSLSTITERTEQSLLDMAPDTTPSRKRRLDTSPLPPPSSIPTSTPQTITPRSSTPQHPQRRSASAIMARRALGLNTPAPRPYAWEKQQAAQKPKEKNADARAAKLQRYMELRDELERLKKDADIKEIEAHSVHRRKRVKIDDLAVIPHNRPGDPSGMFRVPDPDSDDEISVDEDFEESTNVFDATEETEKMQDVPTKSTKPMEPIEPIEPPAPTFMFPEVGQRPAGYHVTEEFKEAAGNVFAEGLAAFMAV